MGILSGSGGQAIAQSLLSQNINRQKQAQGFGQDIISQFATLQRAQAIQELKDAQVKKINTERAIAQVKQQARTIVSQEISKRSPILGGAFLADETGIETILSEFNKEDKQNSIAFLTSEKINNSPQFRGLPLQQQIDTATAVGKAASSLTEAFSITDHLKKSIDDNTLDSNIDTLSKLNDYVSKQVASPAFQQLVTSKDGMNLDAAMVPFIAAKEGLDKIVKPANQDLYRIIGSKFYNRDPQTIADEVNKAVQDAQKFQLAKQKTESEIAENQSQAAAADAAANASGALASLRRAQATEIPSRIQRNQAATNKSNTESKELERIAARDRARIQKLDGEISKLEIELAGFVTPDQKAAIEKVIQTKKNEQRLIQKRLGEKVVPDRDSDSFNQGLGDLVEFLDGL